MTKKTKAILLTENLLTIIVTNYITFSTVSEGVFKE